MGVPKQELGNKKKQESLLWKDLLVRKTHPTFAILV